MAGQRRQAPRGAGCPAIYLDDITRRCRATSPETIEGGSPSSRAISLHDSPLSGVFSMEFRSALVSLA